MKNKNLIIGLGVLAVAGIGYYMWKKKSETKSGACGCSGADGEDTNDYSNAQAGGGKSRKVCDCKEGYLMTISPNGAKSWAKDNTGKLITCECSKALVKGGTSSLANTGYSNAQAGGTKTKFCCSKVDGNGNCVSWTEVNYMKPCSNPKKATFA